MNPRTDYCTVRPDLRHRPSTQDLRTPDDSGFYQLPMEDKTPDVRTSYRISKQSEHGYGTLPECGDLSSRRTFFQQDPLQQDAYWFEQNRKKLRTIHNGRFLAIRNREVIAAADSEGELWNRVAESQSGMTSYCLGVLEDSATDLDIDQQDLAIAELDSYDLD
jgi:hypothetical protein